MLFRASIVAILISTAALLPATAAAQYPPPDGVCVITPSDPNPPADTTITVTVTSTDGDGHAEAGILITLTVTGPGASSEPPSATSDGNGQATFTVQTGTGDTITPAADCDGKKPTAIIPVGKPPEPPETGTGTAGGNSDAVITPLLGLAVILAAGAGGLTLAARRSRG